MDQAIIIVIAGIIFFLVTGVFGILGFYATIKHRKKQAIIFWGLGFLCIGIFIFLLISLFNVNEFVQ